MKVKRIILLLALAIAVNSNAQNFSPSIYSPALWLDASDSTSIIHTSGAVSAWNDISGNNNNALQASTTNKPSYLSTTLGIDFDGSSDVLIGTNLQYGPDTAITLFVVASPNPNSGKGSVIAKGQFTSASDYRIELGENGYDVAVQNAREWNSSSGSWDIAHINMFRTYFTENAEVGYYLNGAREEQPRLNVPYNPNNDPFSIGARFNYSNFFDGQIFEVLLFQSELSMCQMEIIEGYLAHKWGLQAYVISNHTYKHNSFGLCSQQEQHINENSPNGTIIGTLTGDYVASPVTFTNWRIEDTGLYDDMFSLSASGTLSVNDNTYLDYELASSFNIEVSALANGIRVYGEVRINVNDMADGGVQKIHSELWGANGEKWDPRGRLPDFSYVGYQSGEADYTYENTIVDVTTFGAIESDSLSDVTAINAAIASIDSGIVYFPPGLYVIDEPITINKDNLVLRGAGNDSLTGTRFYFPYSGTDLGISGNLHTGDAGYMINFKGANAGPSFNIIEDTKMGDRSVTVDNPTSFEVGDFVSIEYGGTHPSNGELWNHILNHQNHDWPCSVAWSNGSGGLIMYHTIERIEGHVITLQEPIRLDLNVSWSPKLHLRTDWYVINSGIENIFMEHAYVPQPPHLNEPGYNSVGFDRTFNCWINNVTIKHADNGVLFKGSGFGEMKKIVFEGRGGHHGWKFAYSSHCLADTIHFANYDPWIHSFTLTHKANGNVVSNLTGVSGIPVSTDFHRNTPWETLIVNIQNDWNYNSSGVWCAGPNAGKRTVYWNMGGNGFTSFPNWDDYQTTLIGNMQIPEQFRAEKGWHENVPNIQPSNLYNAQLNRRLSLSPDPLFTPDPILGNRENYWERDPSRWRVEDDAYQMFFSETPELTGDRLGEYSVYDSTFTGNMLITSSIASLENTIINPLADASLIVNYQDDNNYYSASINATSSVSGIYKVENGIQTLLKPVQAILTNNYSIFSFENRDGLLQVYENGILLDSIVDNTFTNGKVGFGSSSDASSFDEISLELPQAVDLEEIPSSSKGYHLYPNPTLNEIFIESDPKELSTVRIYDLLGKELTSAATISDLSKNQIRIDLSNLSSGVYIVQTRTTSSKVYKK